MNDSTDSIFHSAKRFFSGTILSRVTGMFRDIAMAFAFGTGESVAAFMVAFRFSHLLRRLLGEGALQTAFIPHFEEFRKENPERAFYFFRDLYGSLSIILLGLILCIVLALAGVLHWMTLSEGAYEILSLTLLMMPSLLFICLFGLNGSLLQCEKQFFVSSVAPVAFNLVWIGGVFALWFFSPEKPMIWLSLAVIISCFSQWLITVPQTWKIIHPYLQGKWKGISFYSRDIKKLTIPLFCGVIGVAASQINNALDAVFARYADLEGPAFLWYAIRLQQLPLALIGIAISSALLPPLSRAIKNQDMPLYRHFLDFTIRRSMSLMLPITFGLFVLGDLCISLIYGRGNFQDTSIVGTTECLWAYTLGLIPMGLILIFAPAFYAKGNYRIPTIGSALAVLLNIGLNTLLIGVWGLGAASVALATSVSAWVNFFFLAFVLAKQSGRLATKAAYISLAKVSSASALAACAVLCARYFIWSDAAVWQILAKGKAHYSLYFFAQVIPFGLQSALFGIVFIGVAWILKVEDFHLKKKLIPLSERK